MHLARSAAVLVAASATLTAPARVAAQQAGGSDADALAKSLSNPVSALISVPFQLNYDNGFGEGGDGERWTRNAQPVVPIELSEHWNLISRTIVPFIRQNHVVPGDRIQSGIGDVTQSLFFSPKAPMRGWIVGAGPAFLVRPRRTTCSARSNGPSGRPRWC